MPKYSTIDQNRIICAAFALHNYIRKNTIGDPAFTVIDQDPEFIPPEILPDVVVNSTQERVAELRIGEMATIRDKIASSLMTARCRS